nr:DNA methyltransferase [Blautia sp. OF11-22]
MGVQRWPPLSRKCTICAYGVRRHPPHAEARGALCEYLIRTYTHPGELVADICVGSGTTAIAAINTERRFVCFETAPSFYAAASERIRAAQAVKSSGEKGV